MRMKTALAVIGLFAAAVSCGPQPLSKQELTQLGVDQVSSTRKAIADSYLRWIDATKAKNVDAAVSLYDDEAVMLPDDANTVKAKTRSAISISSGIAATTN